MKNKLNLGCGKDIRPGWLNVDIKHLEGVGLVGDISKPATFIGLPADYFTHIELSHILEHIADPLPLLEALYRIAHKDCLLSISVPHGACDMAFADPQHIRQYFPSSFQFFAQPAYTRADYGYKGDWETSEIVMFYDPRVPEDVPDDHLSMLAHTQRNFIWEMQATLHPVKPRRLTSSVWEFNPRIILERHNNDNLF